MPVHSSRRVSSSNNNNKNWLLFRFNSECDKYAFAVVLLLSYPIGSTSTCVCASMYRHFFAWWLDYFHFLPHHWHTVCRFILVYIYFFCSYFICAPRQMRCGIAICRPFGHSFSSISSSYCLLLSGPESIKFRLDSIFFFAWFFCCLCAKHECVRLCLLALLCRFGFDQWFAQNVSLIYGIRWAEV